MRTLSQSSLHLFLFLPVLTLLLLSQWSPQPEHPTPANARAQCFPNACECAPKVCTALAPSYGLRKHRGLMFVS
eukprot:CAMPEP_0174943662 /NCGR_PEP_ID=MMETSP1355-20121228/77186_1 /TAXON_ID=464990 /ORGANISM="Hemiselmis tepida, Strain CCMP443" /LENGTH=73 /DNA_ID=CAMNT_0016190917 /DNA_START=4 /DNA_END=222 /DNA_ORIENTATION=+